MKEGRLRADVFADSADARYTVRVAEGLYMRPAYQDSLWAAMLKAPIGKRGDYLYGDLDFHLLARVAERVAGEPLDRFLERNFYRPRAWPPWAIARSARFPKDRIAPTEDDRTFRMRLLRGMCTTRAAILGGVAGHAGLFSDASDLATAADGVGWGGHTRAFVTSATASSRVHQSASSVHPDGARCQRQPPGGAPGRTSPSRPESREPACECVSYLSFGHTGSRERRCGLIPLTVRSVFLSNRVNPDADNKKLGELNIRTRIREVVHTAIARSGAAAGR
ncbi:MAG: serine hydrolase [Flavobacteriales bacterium]